MTRGEWSEGLWISAQRELKSLCPYSPVVALCSLYEIILVSFTTKYVWSVSPYPSEKQWVGTGVEDDDDVFASRVRAEIEMRFFSV